MLADMQKAAIETCLKIHGNAENPNLKCVHSAGGVGNKGNKVEYHCQRIRIATRHTI